MEESRSRYDGHKPKLLSSDIPMQKFGYSRITMGVMSSVHFVPNKTREDWGLDDPS